MYLRCSFFVLVDPIVLLSVRSECSARYVRYRMSGVAEICRGTLSRGDLVICVQSSFAASSRVYCLLRSRQSRRYVFRSMSWARCLDVPRRPWRGIGAIVLRCRVGFPLVPTWLLRRGTLSNVPNILLSPPFSHGVPRWSRLRVLCRTRKSTSYVLSS